MDGNHLINSAHYADHLCMNFIWSPTFASGCYKLCGNLNIPCLGYNIADESNDFPSITKNLYKYVQRSRTSCSHKQCIVIFHDVKSIFKGIYNYYSN